MFEWTTALWKQTIFSIYREDGDGSPWEMTVTQLDVSGWQCGHQGPTLPFTFAFPPPPPALSLISTAFCFFCRLIPKPRQKDQLRAFSHDRLQGFISEPMIYWTETDGEMKRGIDKWRVVKGEREREDSDCSGEAGSQWLWKQTLRSRKTGGISTRSLKRFNRLHTKEPTSNNSSESFHSIGGQLALTELTPCSPHPITPPTLSFPLVSLYLLNLPCSWSWVNTQTFPAQTHTPTPSLWTRPPRQPLWQIERWDTWHQFKQETRIRLNMWFSVKRSAGAIAPVAIDT